MVNQRTIKKKLKNYFFFPSKNHFINHNTNYIHKTLERLAMNEISQLDRPPITNTNPSLLTFTESSFIYLKQNHLSFVVPGFMQPNLCFFFDRRNQIYVFTSKKVTKFYFKRKFLITGPH
jgi:hypothetical protein